MKLPDPATLIEDLHAGALDEEVWARASLAVGDFVGATGIHIFAYNTMMSAVTRTESYRIDPRSADAYQSRYFNMDPLVEPFHRIPVGEPTPEYRLLSAEAWRRSEIYNELALAYDTPHLLLTRLYASPSRNVALSLKSSAAHGPFSADEATRLKRFVPSFRHVIEIKDRLAALQVRADTLAHTLDSVNFGVLVLDAAGYVIESNAVAAEILGARDSGIHVNSRRLIEAIDPAGRALHRWIVDGVPPVQNFDGLFHVPRIFRLPISMLVSPLPRRTTSWIGGDPRWLVLLFDPERRLPVSVDLVARDLGISAREAEVAALLAIGHDMEGIALRLRITHNTIRAHLKSIFSKTGIRSQGELIRRIASGPAALSRD